MIYLYAICIITFIVILFVYHIIQKKHSCSDKIEAFTNRNIDINIANMYINDNNRNTLIIKKIYDAYVDDATDHGNYQNKETIDSLKKQLYKTRNKRPEYEGVLQGISDFGDTLNTIFGDEEDKDPQFRDFDAGTYIPEKEENITEQPPTGPLDYTTSHCNKNSMAYSEFKNDICNSRISINERNKMCSKLSNDNCKIPPCCVLINGTKCRAGDITGPKYTVPGQQYYEFQEKCYGQCEDNVSLLKACGKYAPTSIGVSKECMIQLFNNSGCPNKNPDTIINNKTENDYKQTTFRMIKKEIQTSVDLLKELKLDNISSKICNGVSDDSTNDSTNTSIQTMWEKYNWKKPTTAIQVAKNATYKFKEYVDVENPRTTGTTINVIIQSSSPSNRDITTFKECVIQGTNLLARSFSYRPIKAFLVVIAFDGSFVKQTYLNNNYTTSDATLRMSKFNDTNNPAFGGEETNTFNATTIASVLLSGTDEMGINQTIGREFFHSIQERKIGFAPADNGSQVPHWFWEGSATFIGLQTASKLGWTNSDYFKYGRNWAVKRANSGITKSSLLENAKANIGGPYDPDTYGIGAIAIEFLVANIGMIKFMKIYEPPFVSFADSFKYASGVSLPDFYTMFEEIREVLKIPRVIT